MISLSDADRVFSKIDIDDKTKDKLIANITKRMKPVSYKVCSTFEISCYTFEGIDAVKKALEAREESKEFEVTIRLISSPLYEIATNTHQIQGGIECLKTQLGQIEAAILENSGKFKLRTEPAAIGAQEEEDIENMIRRLNEQTTDDSSSQNREENDEEGMNVHIEGMEESDSKSLTTANTEEEKEEGESDEN